MAAALRVARDPTIDGPVVALLPDSWDRYRSKVFDPEWMKSVP